MKNETVIVKGLKKKNRLQKKLELHSSTGQVACKPILSSIKKKKKN